METCQRVTGKDLPTGEDTRCGAPLDRAGTPKWCKACWAAYHKEYQPNHKKTLDEMAKGKGYAEGAEAMRAYLANQFAKYGAGSFSGTEIAALIRQAQNPQP